MLIPCEIKRESGHLDGHLEDPGPACFGQFFFPQDLLTGPCSIKNDPEEQEW